MQYSNQLKRLISKKQLTSSQWSGHVQTISNFMLHNSKFIGNPNFDAISEEDLGLLFQITDELFFDGLVGPLCEQTASRPLAFRLSKRMTSTGGMTTMFKERQQTNFEIAIATTPLYKSFVLNSKAKVGGLACQSRLEALQRIMQHEMIHLIELLLWKDSDCSRRRFKRMVRQFFGHIESNHQLATPVEIASQRFGIQTGNWVLFRHNGIQKKGFVNRITKRASVLVPDAKGTKYSDGKKYQKYYIPLDRLIRAA